MKKSQMSKCPSWDPLYEPRTKLHTLRSYQSSILKRTGKKNLLTLIFPHVVLQKIFLDGIWI